MKHLIAKEHHPHLKKRAVLEIVGFLALVGISIHQRELISTAFTDIRNGDILYLVLLLSLYWLMVPLTPISYRLLAYRKISIPTTILAQLAGAGPGRIIPGGLGHISIGAMHLHKCGLNMQRAVLVPITNNLIGLTVNLIIAVIAIAYHPTLLDTIKDNLSTQTVVILIILIVAGLTLFQWLSHARKTRKALRRVNKQWKHLVAHLKKHPGRLIYLVIIAVTITLGHSLILKLAGQALSIDIAFSDAIIALSAGVIIGGAVPTPGGLGAVEAGTTSALIVMGYDPAQATSAALLFRTATYWQPLLPGLLSYLYLRERKLL